MTNYNDTDKHEFECETCGRKDELTDLQAYKIGWDYPPFIGMWGVISPRTCPNCMIDTTAYWAIMHAARTNESVKIEDLDERHQATIKRIQLEPFQGIIPNATEETE